MQFFIAIFLSFIPNAFAADTLEEFSVQQGHIVKESVHLLKRIRAGHVTYSIAYQTAGEEVASHAIPETLYRSLRKEFPSHALRSVDLQSDPCIRAMTIQDSASRTVCLDRLDPGVAKGLSRWWRRCRELVGY